MLQSSKRLESTLTDCLLVYSCTTAVPLVLQAVSTAAQNPDAELHWTLLRVR